MDTKQIKQHLLTGSTWIRGLIMLAFILFFYYLGIYVVIFAIIIQFGFVLITGKYNEPLLTFGENLSTYIHQLMRYLTYNTDEKPFPFSNWPTTTVEYKNFIPDNSLKEKEKEKEEEN